MSIFGEITREHRILPHEMSLVLRDYQKFVGRQEEHGKLLGEAMEQSSETFHDNNPAEIVTADQEVLMRGVKPIIYIFRHRVEVDYPDPESPQVSLGSRAAIRVNGGEVFDVDIIGYRDAERHDEVEQVSYLSPLGGVLLGHLQGDVAQAKIGDRETSVDIVSIDQLAVSSLYPEAAAAAAEAKLLLELALDGNDAGEN